MITFDISPHVENEEEIIEGFFRLPEPRTLVEREAAVLKVPVHEFLHQSIRETLLRHGLNEHTRTDVRRAPIRTQVAERVLEPAGLSMTPEVAQWLVGLRADPELQARVDELADRNTEGELTPDELAEYDEYLQVAAVVSALQATARKALSSSTPL